MAYYLKKKPNLGKLDTNQAFLASAGNHSVRKEQKYLTLLEEACKQGHSLLALGKSAEEAVSKAVSVLEDSKLTNAGYGSHLNVNGEVECDASVSRTTDYRFGSVAALQGVKNPVEAAHKLLLYQEDESLKEKCVKFGLVPPCFLAGKSCQNWCKQNGMSTTEDLVADVARKHFVSYTKKLANGQDEDLAPPGKIPRIDSDLINDNEDPGVTDTVGAVAIDMQGNVASACSSGGIALKEPGRIGPAAVFGAGLWTGTAKKEKIKVGVSVSGQGEQLLKTTIAKSIGQKLLTSKNSLLPVQDGIARYFIGAPELAGIDASQRLIGLIAFEHNVVTGSKSFHFGHTTPSFGVGWMSSSQNKPVTKISRQNPFSHEKLVCELHNVI